MNGKSFYVSKQRIYKSSLYIKCEECKYLLIENEIMAIAWELKYNKRGGFTSHSN